MKKNLRFLSILFLIIPLLLFAQSDDTLKRAIEHIVSQQDDSGGWSRLKGEFPIEAEPTSWAVKVLAMNKIYPDRVKRGLDFILKDQRSDGSWNNNTAHTAFAILALREATFSNGSIHRAIDYLRKVQAENGGFRRIGKDGDTLSIYTAVVLCALREANVKREDPVVDKAINFLLSCQNPDGGFGMTRNSPSLAITTAWVLRALTEYGTPKECEFIRKAIEFISKTQKPSGGFAINPEAKEDPEVTAYVILGLKNFPEMRDRLISAKRYLATVQTEDGAFISATPIQFNRVPKKNTQTTCFVAWALTELK